jgi:hypothetical protein
MLRFMQRSVSMVTNWWSVILTSSVISGIVSGIFGFINASKIERLKHELSAQAERSKRLGDAHNDLLTVEQSSHYDLSVAKANPQPAIAALVVQMTAAFDKAEEIYQRIRPLLNERFRGDIDARLRNAQEVNSRVSKELMAGSQFDQDKALIELLGVRDEFITILKSQVADAYAEASRN